MVRTSVYSADTTTFTGADLNMTPACVSQPHLSATVLVH